MLLSPPPDDEFESSGALNWARKSFTKTRKPKAEPSELKGRGMALIEHLFLFVAQALMNGDRLV